MSKNYFGSDFHLGHINVLRYDNRPFDSIEEHDYDILKYLENTLKPGDNFYYMGDFSMFKKRKGQTDRTEEYLDRIWGTGANLYFIKGNHDHDNTIKLYKKYGKYLGGLERIKINGQDIVLCHYAMRVWDKSHYGSWHLYGHSHDNLDYNKESWGKSMDCAVLALS